MGAQSTSMSLGEWADDDQMMWTPSDLPNPRYTLRWVCLQHWRQNIGRQRKNPKTFPGNSLALMIMKSQPDAKQMLDFIRSWRGGAYLMPYSMVTAMLWPRKRITFPFHPFSAAHSLSFLVPDDCAWLVRDLVCFLTSSVTHFFFFFFFVNKVHKEQG